ncbi:SGNH/GDSL hydrolase family protein [Cystobacter fuscus]
MSKNHFPSWFRHFAKTTLLMACAVHSGQAVGHGKAAVIDGWVGTWAASPQASGDTFNAQTLRQIVRTSIGGSVVRVEVSNQFGSQPLRISNVRIALRGNGSSIVSGTDRAITFGGSTQITIPVGARLTSDPIQFQVPAFGDVAISMYLPSATGPATTHQTGQQTNYIAPGDVGSSVNLSNVSTTGSYYFLANLDVQNPQALGSVVTLGASITDGVGSNFNGNDRWPNILAKRLLQQGIQVGVLNQGISGNRSLADGAGLSAEHRFDSDVLAQPGVRWVIYSDDPINDLMASPQPTATQLIDVLKRLIAKAHQNQIKFFCSTLTPYEGTTGWTSSQEQARQQFNSFVRGAASGCDAVIDQDTATHDPANPTRFLPAFDTGDHLHPNVAGLAAIANAVDLGLFTATPSTPLPPVQPPTECGALSPGQGLSRGQSLVSCDGRFSLTLQNDGNLVLYHGSTPLFSTGTVGSTAAEVLFQQDGNLVEYDSAGQLLWQTRTAGQGGAMFYLQNDGNLVIYDSAGSPLWASNTVTPMAP